METRGRPKNIKLGRIEARRLVSDLMLERYSKKQAEKALRQNRGYDLVRIAEVWETNETLAIAVGVTEKDINYFKDEGNRLLSLDGWQTNTHIDTYRVKDKEADPELYLIAFGHIH